MKIWGFIKEKGADLKTKYNHLFTKFLKKYIIDYEIMGDDIKIISSNGDYRIVKNTKSNINKINKAIVQNKISIQRKIDDYEDTYKERFLVLLINIICICGFGGLVCLTFFIGSYLLFIFSILLFSFSVITTTFTSFNYIILVKEVSLLKQLTGYKADSEFNINDFKLTK